MKDLISCAQYAEFTGFDKLLLTSLALIAMIVVQVFCEGFRK